MLYAPFGLNVQAENNTNNQTVDQMFPNSSKQSQTVKKGETAATNNNEETNPGMPDSEPLEFESQFLWFDFVKMFFALAVVIALIYIILRFINKKNRLFGQMKAMENLGGISLGPNRSIQLIRIGEIVLVVGVGETIQLLKEITSPEEIEQLMSQHEVQPIQVGQNLLHKILPKNNDKYENSSIKSFSHMLKGQLEDLAEGRKKVYEKFKKDHDE